MRLSRSSARTDERIRQLAGVELFAACPDRQLELIARLCDDVSFPEGTVLMEEGRTGRECFVLLEGEAIVTIGHEAPRGPGGVARVMGVIGPGDITGEMALIEHGPRSATVKAWSPVRALVFSTQEFDSVLDHVPAVAMRVMRTLAQRLRAVQAA